MSEIDVMPAAAYGPPPVADGAPAAADLPRPAVGDLTLPTLPANNLGREKLVEWAQTPGIWQRIDVQVGSELNQACIVTKFLPKVTSFDPNDTTVDADEITTSNGDFSIDQTKVLTLVEESKAFVLDSQQYAWEAKRRTAVTLATHAANALARAIDAAVLTRLVEAAKARPPQIVEVPPLDGQPGKYGANAFTAVAEAYALLQGEGKYGRYAVAFSAKQFGEAHGFLELFRPAEAIQPLMEAGFYGTGQLPEKHGLVVAVDGENVDIAMPVHGATEFVEMVGNSIRRFRVYTRFAPRIKDRKAIVFLDFK